MISKKYKFIYIHIPKTGGNSIQNALASYCDDLLIIRKSIGNVHYEDGTQGLDVINDELGFLTPADKHASIRDYYQKIGAEINSYFIFTSVRNPWDRVVSQTAFLKEGGLEEGVLKKEELLFPENVLNYISIDGKININAYIRFENLQEDFNEICDRIGIPHTLLPHKNKSRRTCYMKYYSEETMLLVKEKFKNEIDYFGYSFDSSVNVV